MMARLFGAARHAGEPDMRQVLDPFKIAGCHAAGMAKHVADDNAAHGAQNVIAAKGHGAVRRLNNRGGLDTAIATAPEPLQR
jgi:hypothetical protein